MGKNSKFITLENVKQQFKQDCVLTFRGFVFCVDPISLQQAKTGEPIDSGGYPTSIDKDDSIFILYPMMYERYQKAKQAFFERQHRLELTKLTSVRDQEDELVE